MATSSTTSTITPTESSPAPAAEGGAWWTNVTNSDAKHAKYHQLNRDIDDQLLSDYNRTQLLQYICVISSGPYSGATTWLKHVTHQHIDDAIYRGSRIANPTTPYTLMHVLSFDQKIRQSYTRLIHHYIVNSMAALCHILVAMNLITPASSTIGWKILQEFLTDHPKPIYVPVLSQHELNTVYGGINVTTHILAQEPSTGPSTWQSGSYVRDHLRQYKLDANTAESIDIIWMHYHLVIQPYATGSNDDKNINGLHYVAPLIKWLRGSVQTICDPTVPIPTLWPHITTKHGCITTSEAPSVQQSTNNSSRSSNGGSDDDWRKWILPLPLVIIQYITDMLDIDPSSSKKLYRPSHEECVRCPTFSVLPDIISDENDFQTETNHYIDHTRYALPLFANYCPVAPHQYLATPGFEVVPSSKQKLSFLRFCQSHSESKQQKWLQPILKDLQTRGIVYVISLKDLWLPTLNPSGHMNNQWKCDTPTRFHDSLLAWQQFLHHHFHSTAIKDGAVAILFTYRDIFEARYDYDSFVLSRCFPHLLPAPLRHTLDEKSSTTIMTSNLTPASTVPSTSSPIVQPPASSSSSSSPLPSSRLSSMSCKEAMKWMEEFFRAETNRNMDKIAKHYKHIPKKKSDDMIGTKLTISFISCVDCEPQLGDILMEGLFHAV